jgi:hypothetical protein
MNQFDERSSNSSDSGGGNNRRRKTTAVKTTAVKITAVKITAVETTAVKTTAVKTTAERERRNNNETLSGTRRRVESRTRKPAPLKFRGRAVLWQCGSAAVQFCVQAVPQFSSQLPRAHKRSTTNSAVSHRRCARCDDDSALMHRTYAYTADIADRTVRDAAHQLFANGMRGTARALLMRGTANVGETRIRHHLQ